MLEIMLAMLIIDSLWLSKKKFTYIIIIKKNNHIIIIKIYISLNLKSFLMQLLKLFFTKVRWLILLSEFSLTILI